MMLRRLGRECGSSVTQQGGLVKVPKYISDYVSQLNEQDVRRQYAQLLAKRQSEKRKETLERWRSA